MIPRADPHGDQAPEDIGEDVVRVEVAAVREEGLQEFAADAEEGGADGEGEVEGAAARGVEDPVEAEGQEEEGQEVEGFVVDVQRDLEGGEAEVGGCEEEEEEGSLGVASALSGADGGDLGGLGTEGSLPAKGSRMRMVLNCYLSVLGD